MPKRCSAFRGTTRELHGPDGERSIRSGLSCFPAKWAVREGFPASSISRPNGAIWIDLNTYPRNIAWVEVNPRGQLLGYDVIRTDRLEAGGRSKRNRWGWRHAHKVVRITRERYRAIALKRLWKGAALQGMRAITANPFVDRLSAHLRLLVAACGLRRTAETCWRLAGSPRRR